MTGRIYRAGFADAPAASKGRIYRAGLTGSAAATPKGRIYRAGLTGALGVAVTPIPDMADLEPETIHTITATLVGGGSADSWAWRPVTGAASIVGTGATVDITAPSHLNGTTVTIGVRATKDGVQSVEETFTMAVLPQTEWWWSGTSWIPRVEVWA